MVSPVLIRSLLAIAVTAVLAGIAAVVLRSGSAKPAAVQTAVQQLPKNIDIALKKARFSEIRDGSVVWELVAENVQYDKRGEVAHLSAIQMDFAPSGSVGAIKVTAKEGEYLGANRDVTLRGKVHLETEDGLSFDTDSIVYNASRSRFRTADQVRFHQQRLTLTAVGLEMGVKEQTARFLKTVDATVAGGTLAATAAGQKVRLPAVSEKSVDRRRKGKER